MADAATVFRHAHWEEFGSKLKTVPELTLPEEDYKGWQKEVRVGAN